MSKYLPLFWDKRQIPALLYRIYINIFSIFLRIPILPMGFSWKYKTLDIYYRGDDLICFFKKGKLRYQSITSGGEFSSLSEINRFWDGYFEACAKANEKLEKEYNYRIKNGLCTEVFCDIEGEHKKHEFSRLV